MRIFVYEAVTGGAMVHDEPPPALVHEADLMVRTLLAELSMCEGVTLVTTRDERLPPVAAIETFVADRLHDPMVPFDVALNSADAAWVIAPESGGMLERLARRVADSGRPLLGSSADALAVAGSKRRTAETLAMAGIPVVPTFSSDEEIPPLPGLWVVKPDDGAGAEGNLRCWDAEAAREQMRPGMVAQPWIEGESLSLSLLCANGGSRLLSINRQVIGFRDEQISLSAITVNAMTDPTGTFAALGQDIARALPGLWGWIGVDLILMDGAITILEVNPRLTTSYCGFAAAKGINVAELVLELFRTGLLPDPDRIPVGTPFHLDLRLPDAS